MSETKAAPVTHSVALATTRDAIVGFGALTANGFLLVPVERRIAQYLRRERLFVAGGADEQGNTMRSCYSLDTAAGVWVSEAPMTVARHVGFGLCVLHGHLWAVGGEDSRGNALRSCERLDFVTNTWVRGPDMVTARSSVAVAVLNGEIWAVGGMDSTGRHFASCERLDTATGTWVAGPNTHMGPTHGAWGDSSLLPGCMTMPRSGHCVAVFRGELWVVGGDNGSTQRLDAVTNRWVRGPDITLCFCRLSCGLAIFQDKMWVVGGHDAAVFRSCEYFDDASDTWVPGPRMSTPRFGHGLAVLDGQMWAVGGSADLSGDVERSCVYLDAVTNVWVRGPDLPVPTTSLCCVVTTTTQ